MLQHTHTPTHPHPPAECTVNQGCFRSRQTQRCTECKTVGKTPTPPFWENPMMFNLSCLLFRHGGRGYLHLISFSCKWFVLLPPASTPPLPPPPPLHVMTETFGEQEFAKPAAIQHVHAMTCGGWGGGLLFTRAASDPGSEPKAHQPRKDRYLWCQSWDRDPNISWFNPGSSPCSHPKRKHPWAILRLALRGGG